MLFYILRVIGGSNRWMVQGVPFEKCHKEMALSLKRCIFDPVFENLKCIWKAVVFEELKKPAEKCKQIFENLKNYRLSNAFRLFKHEVNYAPFQVLQPFLSDFFQIEHHIPYSQQWYLDCCKFVLLGFWYIEPHL